MSLLLLFQSSESAALSLESGSITIAGGDLNFRVTTNNQQATGGLLLTGLAGEDRRVRHHYILPLGPVRIRIEGGELQLWHYPPRDPLLDEQEIMEALFQLAI